MSRLANFFRLSTADRWLVLEALAWLGLARAAVLILPFRWVAAGLGQQNIAGAAAPSPDPRIRRVAWAIRRASRHTPWCSNCLAQAIAGQCMLRRRRIASMLYFGVTKNRQGQLVAHAWLRSGGMILTGGSELDGYAVVATFTSD